MSLLRSPGLSTDSFGPDVIHDALLALHPQEDLSELDIVASQSQTQLRSFDFVNGEWLPAGFKS